MILASQRSSSVRLWPSSWPTLIEKPPIIPVESTTASTPYHGRACVPTNHAAKIQAIHKTGTKAQKDALWNRLVTEVAIQANMLGKTKEDIEENVRRELKKIEQETED